MTRIYFELRFLNDVILSKSSNTEGNIEPLDYVNGACFLGIVAKKYDEFSNPFEIFHSGAVRFSDAYPLLKGQRAYKMPLCFFAPKLDVHYSEVYNHHFASETLMLEKQLRQLRSGFITSGLDVYFHHYFYAQKSAYDSEKMRTKDGSMFGYTAFRAGSKWGFFVSFNQSISQEDRERISTMLCQTHCIGKSKSAQYGKVKISLAKDQSIHNTQNLESITLAGDTTYVYVDSALALFNGAMPTLIPTSENLGLRQGSIDWSKTHIRSSKYSPFNFKRQGKDTSRLIIEKGSIIALSNASSEDIATLKSGVGGFLSEGYGEVLINPSFVLQSNAFALKEFGSESHSTPQTAGARDSTLLAFLTQRDEQEQLLLKLGEEVDEFIAKHKDKFSAINSAQWGSIRSYAQFEPQSYKAKIEKYIRFENGELKPQWEKGERVFSDVLKNKSLEFLKLLCNKMPKQRNAND